MPIAMTKSLLLGWMGGYTESSSSSAGGKPPAPQFLMGSILDLSASTTSSTHNRTQTLTAAEIYWFCTSVTTSSSGAIGSQARYKPFPFRVLCDGEMVYSSGTLPTKYTFTGQYSNVSDFGLMYYGARWYDVSLGRFASADTIIPGAGNPMAWDRFAYSNNNPVNYTDPSGHWSIPSFNFNSRQLAQDFTNWALDKTGLSNLGFTTSDVQQGLSIAGTGLDVIAEGTDVIAVGLSVAATVAGTALGAPEIGYGVGEALALGFLQFGNCMATMATISSLGSDLLTGDAGLELSVISSDNSLEVHGELSLGTSSTVGMITTGIGWIPGLPSYASLGLQSIAVANDFSLGQKIGIFNGTSYKIPIDISTSSGDQPYLNNNQPIPY